MIKEFYVSKNLLNPDSKTTNQTGDERWGGEFAAGTYYVLNNTSGNIFWRDGVSSTGSSPIASGAGAVVTVQNALVVWHSSRDVKIMVADSSVAVPFEPYGNTWNTKSYAKSITGAQTYTKFPIVLRTTEQSIPTWSMNGNTGTSGTPSPSSPITINGCGDRTANLSPVGSFTIAAHDASQRVDIFSGTLEAGNYVVALNQDNAISGSTRNTLQVTVGGTTYYNSSSANYHNQSGQQKMTFTVAETGNVDVKYWANDLNENCSYSNITFNAGSEVINEPFGYKIPLSSNGTALTPVYLSAPLLAKETAVDTLTSDGTVSYNLRKYVLTGNETVEVLDSGQAPIRISGIYFQRPAYDACTWLCTHYPCVPNSASWGSYDYCLTVSTQDSDSQIRIRDINYNSGTAADFKAFLAAQYAAGTPVTIWIKAQTRTETVTVPTIPTTSGLNTIDVNTTVKPSEMSLTYDGYKICKPKRKSENIYDKYSVLEVANLGTRYGQYVPEGVYSIYNDTDNRVYWGVQDMQSRFIACEPHSTATVDMSVQHGSPNYGFMMPYNDDSLGNITIVQGSTAPDHYIPYWK